jgi:hypothetical protein
MQCILYKIYFWKVFHKYYNLICTPICTKFYSCKKWVLQPHHSAEVGYDTVMYPVAQDPASQLGRAPALPCAPRHRILPSCSGGLRRCQVSHGTGSRLPTLEGSGAAMCPTGGPCLTAREGSIATTCPTALDLASLLAWAPALPHVPRHRIPPPSSGGL